MSEETVAPGPRRRTLIGGAAWSIPVVIAAGTAPMAAASTTYTIEFSQAVSSFGSCATSSNGAIRVLSNGTPAPGVAVSVLLPSGLVWSDHSTGAKQFTTDASGSIPLIGRIFGTGVAGTFTLVASPVAVSAAAASSQVSVTSTNGVIWYSANQSTAATTDPTATVEDARDLVVTTSYVYVITATGEWFVKFGADAVNPYRQVTGVPAIDSVWGGLGSNYGYALAGGAVYKTAATTTAVQVSGVSDVVSLAPTGGRIFALTSSGSVYRATDGAASFTQVTLATSPTTPLIGVTSIAGNQGGGYGWAISGTDVYYILDNNLAYLSTTVAGAKPAAPVALAIGAAWAYALDADGTVWGHFSASAGAWQQLTGLPGAATEISVFLGGDTLWALSGGTPYWSSNASTWNTSNVGALAGDVEQLWTGASYAYARTSGGEWWRVAGASTSAAWSQITGTPGNTVTKIATNYGNYAFALADKNDFCTS